MANKFWIGSSGNWSDTSHWSASSGGGGGAVVPTLTDDVYFNNLSFTGTSTITIDATANCLSMSWSGITQNVTLQNSAYNLNIYGNLYLWTGLTWTFTSTGYLYMKATDSRTITSNGISISSNRLYIDGVGGTITHNDNLNAITEIRLDNGGWNTNGKTITISSNISRTSNVPAMIINLSSSTINCANWYPIALGGETFICGTSTINCGGGDFSSYGIYYNVIYTPTLNNGIYGTGFYKNLTIVGRSNVVNDVPLRANQYITGTLTLIGSNSTNYRLLISSDTIGTTRTITCSNVVASNVDFRDISVPLSMSSSWNLSGITGGSGDCGGNLNITFTPSQTQYWYEGTGSWNNNSKWFQQTSGITSGRVPLPQDDVIFDGNSFSGTSTVTVNCPRIGKNLSMSGVTQAVTFTLVNVIECYGNYVLGNNITVNDSSNYQHIFYGTTIHNFNSYGKSLYDISFKRGTYINLSIINVLIGNLRIYNTGVFDFNDFDATIFRLDIEVGTPTVYLGNGTITIVGNFYAGRAFYLNTPPSNFYAEGSTIKFLPSYTIENISMGLFQPPYIFNKVWFGGLSTGYFEILGSNTISELRIDAGRKVCFTAGTTTTVTNLIAEGTTVSGITISSVTNSPHTLVKSGSGTVTVNNCNISYSTASSSFRALNSTDGGSNTGWQFLNNINRYWVGGTGNWSDTSHWSNTSGGTSGASVPTSGNTVYFNSLSFTGTSTVTIDTTANCFTMDWTGINQNVTLTNSAYNLNVYGSLILYTGLTWNFTSIGYLYMKATDPQSITSNSVLIKNYLYFDGVGGIWTNQDDFNALTVYLANGTWITNNKSINLDQFMLSTGTKTLTLGNSTFTTGRFYNLTTNFIFNYNTSTFILGGSANAVWSQTFYNLNLVGYSNVNSLPIYGDLTVINSLVISGTDSAANRLLIATDTVGTQRKITASNVVASNVDFRDIYLSGFTIFNLSGITGGAGDCLGNSGITFTPSQTQYFKSLAGSVNWSDSSKWFSDYSPRTTLGRVPLPQDDVIFDENSLTGTTSLSFDCSRIGKNINMSGITQILNGINLSLNVIVHGDFVLGNMVSYIHAAIHFYGRGNHIINAYGKTIGAGAFYCTNSGRYTFMSNARFNGWTTMIYSGTVDLNDYDITHDVVFSLNGGTLYMGNGTLSLTWNAADGYNTFSNSNGTLYCEGSTIKFLNGGSNIGFYGGYGTYNKVWFSSGTSDYVIYGTNTISELVIDSGKTVKFEAGKTNTITSKLSSVGTSASGITLSSATTGSTFTILATTGCTVDVKYSTISYSVATNPLSARMSINNSTNTGWSFSTAAYWIGGSGNWNDSLHWSSTSGGLSGGTLGLELFSNTGFDTDTIWIKDPNPVSSGWSISGGTAICNGTNNGILYQSPIVVSGKSYSMTFTVITYNSGSIRGRSQSGDWLGTLRNSIGTYTETFTSNLSGTAGVISVSFNGSIDNLSIKEIITSPTSAIDVIFDANSFSGTSTVTINTGATCNTMDWTGINRSVTLSNSAYNLNIYGSLILATGLTWTFTSTGYLYFKSTYIGNFITSNGVTMNSNSLYFDGVGGVWNNTDDLLLVATSVYVTNGIFNTNGKSLFAQLIRVDGGVGSMNFSNSIINLTANSTMYLVWFSPNTITATNSTMNLNFQTYFCGINVNTNVLNNINIFGVSYYQGSSNTLVCNNLTLSGTTNVGNFFRLYGNISVLNTLTLFGYNSTNYRLLINSDTVGTQRKITASNVSASNVDFRDIYLSGTTTFDLSNITGGSGDACGNSGITFTPSQTQYFKHTSGAVSWSNSTKWYSDYSPRTTLGRVPLPQDDAVFDSLSFSGTSTLTFDCLRIGRSLNMSGVTQTITFSLLNNIEQYGSHILYNNITVNANGYYIYLMGRGNYVFNSYGKTIYGIHSYAFNGFYTNQSNIVSTGGILFHYGTFDFNDYSTNSSFIWCYTAVCTTYFGNGILTIADGGDIFSTDGIIYAEGSTIKMVNLVAGSASRIALNSKTINNMWLTKTGFSYPFNFTTNGTMNTLTVDAGNKVSFGGGTTNTIKTLTAIGTSVSGITIASITSGLTHNLVISTGGTVDVRYATITNSNITPPTMAKYSINGGGNTGWTFTTPTYWIGGTGNWNDPTHWSATSGGLSGTTLSQELLLNSGAIYETDWIDSNSDGLADGWRLYGGGSDFTIQTNAGKRSQRNTRNAAAGVDYWKFGFQYFTTDPFFSPNKTYQVTITAKASKPYTIWIRNYVTYEGFYPVLTTGFTTQVFSLSIGSSGSTLQIISQYDAFNSGSIGDWFEISDLSIKEIYLIPTSLTEAIFDNNSFSGTSTVTINADANCCDLNFSGITQSVTLINSAYNLNIYGNITEHPTLITYNFTSTGYLYIKGNCIITTNGNINHVWNRWYIDASGCTVQHADDFGDSTNYNYNLTTTVFLANGNWNTNNHNITLRDFQNGSITSRTLTLGSSNFLIRSWVNTTPAGFTFNYNTSTVVFNNCNSNDGCFGTTTFYNITIVGDISKTAQFIVYQGNVTVMNQLIANGYNSKNCRILFYSDVLGTQRTITANSWSETNCDFRDIKITGNCLVGGTLPLPLDGLRGDAGGNSGITFTPSQTQYWYQGTGSWSNSSKWTSRVPLPQDDAVFDSLSFSGTSTLTFDCLRIGRSLNMSGVTQTIIPSALNDIECYGDFILCSGFTSITNHYVYLMGRGNTYNINPYNTTLYGLQTQSSANYNFLSGFTVGYILSFYGSGTVNLGDSIFTFLMRNSTLFFCNTATNLICGTSTFKYVQTIGGMALVGFNGNGKIYNKLWLVGSADYNDYVVVYGANNTFNELQIDAGRKIKFTEGTTTTINKLSAIGTSTSGITIGSVTSGSTHTITLSSGGTADVRFATISDSKASPNLIARSSTDAYGNSGWTFTTPRYWIGGTGNWNDPTHWSATSGGLSGTSVSQIELILNGGASGQTNFIDSDSDGKADYFYDSYGSGTMSIVTGNGFSRAQRIVCNNGALNMGISQTCIIPLKEATSYSYSVKYRSNKPVHLYRFGVYQQDANLPTNTGTCATFSGIGVNYVYPYFLFIMYVADTEVGDWMEIGEISVKEIISLPISTSDVIFDANSFSGTSTVTINTGATCNSMDWSGITQSVTLSNSAYNLEIYGSLTLYTGLIWNWGNSTGKIYFKSTNSGNFITSNGISMSSGEGSGGSIYFDSVSGSWTLQDDFTGVNNCWIYFLNGTFNTNNKTMNASVFTSPTGSLILNLGSSTINLSNWFYINCIVNAGTSTINASSVQFGATGIVWYNVNLTTQTNTNLNIYGGTYNNLTLNHTTYSSFIVRNDIKVNGLFTYNGNNSTNYRGLLYGYTIGTQNKITVNNISISNADFRDIYLSGSTIFDLSNITGLAGDCGGNYGITFTPSQTQTWYQGTGSWSNPSKWTSRVPLPQDDAIFDSNSFSGTSTLTVDCVRIGRSLNMSGVTQSINMNTINNINNVECYGDFILGSNITLGVYYHLHGRGNHIINTYGKTVHFNDIGRGNGSFTFMSDINSITSIWFSGTGKIDFNDFNIQSSLVIQFNGSNTAYLGNGTISMLYNIDYAVWQCIPTTTLYCEGSTIKFNPSGGFGTLRFGGGSKIYNKVWLSGTHTGTFDILDTNTINELVIDAGRKVRFTNGTTNTIKTLTAIGTSTSGITIGSVTSGLTHNIVMLTGGTVDVRYATISDSNITPTGQIDREGTNGGNNTGWTFTSAAYWIGGTGNWNDPTHWSSTSGGVSGGTYSPELILNGGFDSGLIYWTNHATYKWDTAEWISGRVHLISNGVIETSPYQSFYQWFSTPLKSGSTYRIKYDLTIISGYTQITVINSPVGSNIGYQVTNYSNFSEDKTFVCTSNGGAIEMYCYGTTLSESYVDNVSVTEVLTVPTSVTDVIFDVNSFSGTSTITINSTANCGSMDWTGINQSVTLTNSAYNLNIYGSLILATGLTWTFTSTGYLYFKSTYIGNFITSNGVIMNSNSLYFDGVGGVWTNQDDWNVNSYVYINAGTWNTNNKTIGYIVSLFALVTGATLTLGSSIISCGRWAFTNATLNYGTSTIVLTSRGNWIYISRCYNLTIITVAAQSNIIQPPVGDFIVDNILTFAGENSTTGRMLFGSYNLGTQIKVTAASVVASNVDFRDIYLSGSTIFNLSGITGGSGNCGGNSGITFTPAQTQYWYQGTDSWSNSSKWFTQSSGITQGRVPLPQDTAIFDGNSFSGTSTVTVDVPRIGSLNMSGVTQAVTFTLANNIECYDSYILGNNITPSGNVDIYMRGRGDCVLNTYEKTLYRIYISTTSPSRYTNYSNLVFNALMVIDGGTFDFNDFNYTSTTNTNGNGLDINTAANCYMGNGTFLLAGGFPNQGIGSFYAEGSTIKFVSVGSTGTNHKLLTILNKIYNKVWISGTYADNFDMIGSATFNELIIDAGRKVRFTESTTTTINALTAVGTSVSGITIGSVTSGQTHNLVSTGVVNVKYATISNSSITPSPQYARLSTDGGGNTGWNFSTTKYWVGGTGNWSDTAHWSNASGGATGATLPTQSTNVTFDSNSFSGTSTVTIDTITNCLSLDMIDLNQNVTINNSAYNFNVYGNLTENGTYGTWNFTATGYMYIRSNCMITTNGTLNHNLNRLNIDASGCTVFHSDDFTITGYIGLANGTWNTNSKKIDSNYHDIGTLAGTKTVTFGSSTIITDRFQIGYTPIGLTVTPNTSTIITNYSLYFGGKTWYNVIVTELSGGYGAFNDGGTFNDLTLIGYGRTLSSFQFYSDLTINGTLTITGSNNTNYRMLLNSNTLGTQRTITANNVVASNVDFRDIYLSGSTIFNLSGITGLSGDAGGNSGITFTPSQTQYWHVGTGSWSNSSKWFTSTNGIGSGRVPLPQDDTIFDNNSFDTSGTLTVDCARIGKSLSMSGVTQDVNVSLNLDTEIYGSFILGKNITMAGARSIYLFGRSSYFLNTFEKTCFSFRINCINGSYTNLSNINMITDNGYIFIFSGTFDMNDYNFTGGQFYGQTPCIVYGGDGLITINATSGDGFYFPSGTFYCEKSTIKFYTASGSGTIRNGSGISSTFNKLWFSGSHTGTFDIIGNNTFNEIIIDAGRKVRFAVGSSQVITRLISLGKPSNLITMGSVTSGSTYTLSSLPNNWLVDYTNIQDSVTPPTKYAGINSVNVSNNSGWDFISSKIRYWIGNSGNFTDTSHWSLQSNGVSGASVPTSGETAIFDRYSFTSTGQTITLNSTTSVLSMHWVDVTQTAVTFTSNGYDLNIYAHLYLISGLTWNFTNANIYFKSPYTGNAITTNGVTITASNIYFDNLTGVWTNQDNFTTTAIIHQQNGTWNTNDYVVSVNNYQLETGVKSLILGKSTFTTNNFDISSNSNGYTITPNTSKIVSTTTTMLNQTLYDVECVNFSSGTSPTLHNLKISGGTTWVISGTPIISGTLQIYGINSTTNRFLLTSDVLRTQRTINASTVIFSNIDIRDINGINWNLSGITGGSSDVGGNSGIIFTPSTIQNWTQGSGNWSDITKWTSRVPLVQDTALFDSNSFIGTSILTIDLLRIGSINMSGITQSVTISGDTYCYGGVYLNNYVTINNLNLYSRTTNYINLSNSTINNINVSGVYTNQSNFNCSSFTLTYGSFTLGNYTIGINNWSILSGLVYTSGSTLKFLPTGSTTFTFNGGSQVYNNLWLSGTHTGFFDILGNNTFNQLTIDTTKKVRFQSNSTQIMSALNTSGITITSTSNSGHTLIINQNETFLDYDSMNISYSNVSPLYKFYATNSINGGNNSGWIFSNVPLLLWSQKYGKVLLNDIGRLLW